MLVQYVDFIETNYFVEHAVIYRTFRENTAISSNSCDFIKLIRFQNEINVPQIKSSQHAL